MKKVLFALLAFGALASCSTSPQASNSSQTGASLDVVPTFWNAKHVIQVWADFQCPACQSTNKSIGPVIDKLVDEGKLTVEYRQFPLTRIHQNAFGDAMAAMCAYDQNKYKEYKNALYDLEESKKNAAVSDSDRIALAETTGLNKDEFSSCLSSKKYSDYVTKSIETGTSLGVTGTPTYFLNGKKLPMNSFPTIESFREFLEKAVQQ